MLVWQLLRQECQKVSLNRLLQTPSIRQSDFRLNANLQRTFAQGLLLTMRLERGTVKKKDMREQFLWGNHAGSWQLEAKHTLFYTMKGHVRI